MFVLDSNRKGAIAEAEITAAAVRLGVPAFAPVAEHGRADLALEIGGRLWRVQCKWGRPSADGAVIVITTGGSRRVRSGYLRSTYDATEIDLFGVWCDHLDRAFLIPVDVAAGQHQLHLRLTPPRNHQRGCITLAEDFTFEGAVAQLEERRHGMAEVRGSSPLSSTSGPGLTATGVNAFRDHLGWWLDRVAAGEAVILTRYGRPMIRMEPADSMSIG